MSQSTRTDSLPSPSLLDPCRTPDELWRWIEFHLHLRTPRRAVCPNHQAPFDYLKHAYFEPAGDCVVWAPRGGGKTRLGAVATLLDLLHKPGIEIRILGGSLEQSLKMWDHLGRDLEYYSDRGQIELKHLKSRSAQLVSGSNVSVLTQSERAIRGVRVQKLRCDEVDCFDERVWEAAQLVTRSRRSAAALAGAGAMPADVERPASCPTALAGAGPAPSGAEPPASCAAAIEAISTWHDPFGLMGRIVERAVAAKIPVFQWCLMEVLERCPPQRPCKQCELWTECAGRAKQDCDGFLSIDDAVVMKRRVSLETWNAEMLCQRPLTRGRVFPMFDRAIHVSDIELSSTSPHSEIWWGIDFGFKAPFVCLWIQRTPGTDARAGAGAGADEVYVADEYVREAMMLDEHLRQLAIRKWPRPQRIACDPAGAGPNDQTAVSNVQLLRRRGHAVRYRKSLIQDGVELIRAGLCCGSAKPRLRIHPRCDRLIVALEAYRYDDGAGERPLKDGRHDHLIDALRYFYINAQAGDVDARAY